MIRKRSSSVAIVATTICLVLAGCDYPMDVENTTRHVLDSHSLRSGIVVGSDNEAAARDAARDIADRADAEVAFEEGAAESLMRKLEDGDLDIVLGVFAKDSPWKKRAILTSSPAAKNPAKSKPVVRGALRRGENRWYMFVEEAFMAGST